MKNSTQTIWVGLSFLTVGFILALIVLPNGPFGQAKQDSGGVVLTDEPTMPTIEIVPSVSADDDAMIGDPNAPVTIVEFSDFQCPYCSKFVTDSMGLIQSEYIDQGLVKLVFRDFPLGGHPNAHVASETAECVRAQSDDLTYFVMHDAIFANQAAWSALEDPIEYFVGLASETAGVDVSSCLENGEMAEEVDADFAAGRSYGVTGTPTFFVNGKKLVGAYPFDVIKELIDSEL